MSPVTCFCDAWRLEAAASYVEADVSAGLPQLVTAAGYIKGDASPFYSGGFQDGCCNGIAEKLLFSRTHEVDVTAFAPFIKNF